MIPAWRGRQQRNPGRASAGPPALLASEELARMAPPPLIVQVTDRETFARGHVPNAVLVEPRELVAGIPPAVGRLPPGERLTALFRRIGYHPAQDVVVLDDEGGGWAGRFAWTLDVIGHGRVARGCLALSERRPLGVAGGRTAARHRGHGAGTKQRSHPHPPRTDRRDG